MENNIDNMNIIVIKRNGGKVEFDGKKIAIAIKKAFDSVNKKNINNDEYLDKDINKVYTAVLKDINKTKKERIKIEEIQDLIEKNLKKLGYLEIFTAFSEYRENRKKSREVFFDEKKVHKFLTVLEDVAVNKDISSLARMYEELPGTADTKLKNLGKMVTKQYATLYLLKKKISEAHENGDIFIEDIEYMPMGTTKSCMINLPELFKEGFSSGVGTYREPKHLASYGVLTYIALDRLKDEQHGKPGIAFFEKYMAEGLLKTFKREFKEHIHYYLEYTDLIYFVAIGSIEREIDKKEHIYFDLSDFDPYIRGSEKVKENLEYAYKKALETTKQTLYKTMEAFVHNLNHKKYDEDKTKIAINISSGKTRDEILVSKMLLKVIKKGVGRNNSPIEPNIYFALDSEDRYIFKELLKEKEKSEILEEISSNRENINNKDKKKLKYNKNTEPKQENLENIEDLKTYLLEKIELIELLLKTMLCRKNIYLNILIENEEYARYIGENIRIGKNEVDDKNNSPEGRGELASAYINLGRVALKSIKAIEKGNVNKNIKNKLENVLKENLNEKLELLKLALFDRFDYQCDMEMEKFPFLFGENVWIESEKLKKGDRLRKVLKNGNLNIGVTGLYEASAMIIEFIYKDFKNEEEKLEKIFIYAKRILKYIYETAKSYSKELNLNFKIVAGDAKNSEFMKLDRIIYGHNKYFKNKEKYLGGTDFPEDIDLIKKVEYESQLHKYTGGGNLTEINLKNDSNINKNVLKLFEVAEKNDCQLLKFNIKK